MLCTVARRRKSSGTLQSSFLVRWQWSYLNRSNTRKYRVLRRRVTNRSIVQYVLRSSWLTVVDVKSRWWSVLFICASFCLFLHRFINVWPSLRSGLHITTYWKRWGSVDWWLFHVRPLGDKDVKRKHGRPQSVYKKKTNCPHWFITDCNPSLSISNHVSASSRLEIHHIWFTRLETTSSLSKTFS